MGQQRHCWRPVQTLLHNFGNLGTRRRVRDVRCRQESGASSDVLLQTFDSTTSDTQLWSSNATVAGTAVLHDFGNLGSTGGHRR